jgi:hypothetical protein
MRASLAHGEGGGLARVVPVTLSPSCFRRKGELLATGSFDTTIGLWDA